MRKFRLVPVAVAALIGATSLAACGGSGTTATSAEKNLAFNQLPACPLDALAKAPKPVKITMWTDAVVESYTATQDLVEKFNKSQTDVQVELVKPFGAESNAKNIHSAFVQMNGLTSTDRNAEPLQIPAGTKLPSLVQLDSYRLREMADSGAVLPAQSCINDTNFDMSGISPAAEAYYSVGGVQWPAYMIPSVPLMQFNAEQFKKAGLDPDKPPKTIKELEAAAKKLQASGVKHPISLPADPNLIESWLTGAGATLVSDGNGRASSPHRATFFTEAAVELFTDLQRMFNEGLINLHDNSNGNIDHLIDLATGSSTITFEASSSTTSIAAIVGGDANAVSAAQQVQGGSGLGGVVTTDYRAAPLPGLRKPGQASISGSAWYITRGVPEAQQAAAWKFAEFVYKPENQFSLLTKFGALPVSTAVAQQDNVKNFFAKGGLAGRWLSVADTQFENLDPALPGPLIGPYEDFFTIMRNAMFALQGAQGAQTPSQILTNSENEFTHSLASYNTAHG